MTSNALQAVAEHIEFQIKANLHDLELETDPDRRLWMRAHIAGLRTALHCVEWEATRPQSKVDAEEVQP